MRSLLLVVCVALLSVDAYAFVGPQGASLLRLPKVASKSNVPMVTTQPRIRNIAMCAASAVSESAPVPPSSGSDTLVRPQPPRNENQMLSAAKTSVLRAFADGKNRLKLRFLVPRDGQLLPTDEDWPGGIMQLYKAVSPLVRNLVRTLAPAQQTPLLKEQRLDPSGVDGMSLWISQCQSPRDDTTAFCQPNTEVIDTIRSVCATAGPRLVLLVNPQWRETQDMYDTMGKQGGLLGKIGNFLGGTSGARQEVAALGFVDAYMAQQYVVGGDDCQIIKAYPYPNWVVYTTSDDGRSVLLGEQIERPTYQDIQRLLESKGIAARWAREAGVAKGFSSKD